MQTRQVSENIRTALDEAGATFADVAKLTDDVLDASQVQVVRDVRDTFIEHWAPAGRQMLVQVRRLVREEFLIEVDAIANVRGVRTGFGEFARARAQALKTRRPRGVADSCCVTIGGCFAP